jgi:large subunit ribosomal protein L35
MPKMKTKKAVAKRLIKTGTGKLKAHKAYKGKSAKCKRELQKRSVLAKGDAQRLKALIAYK